MENDRIAHLQATRFEPEICHIQSSSTLQLRILSISKLWEAQLSEHDGEAKTFHTPAKNQTLAF
jgi:hypothetical protein